MCTAPEAFTTQNGVSRSSFRLAVNRPYRNPQGNYDADFLPVIAWRQTADFCNKYLDKGRQVAVEGSIQTRSYDAQDGSKRYVTEIMADNIESVKRADSGAQGGARPNQQPKQTNSMPEGFTEVADDGELPF